MRKLSKGLALSRVEGFTIIELIVVIAIIAVLAGIVLVNVQQYVAKAKDSAIKASLDGLPAVATSFFESGGSFAGVCITTAFNNVKGDVEKNSGSTFSTKFGCTDTYMNADTQKSEWAACGQLNIQSNFNEFWCVDSDGFKGTIPEIQCTGIKNGFATSCPVPAHNPPL